MAFPTEIDEAIPRIVLGKPADHSLQGKMRFYEMPTIELRRSLRSRRMISSEARSLLLQCGDLELAPRRKASVLWTIFVMLLVLWALGLVSSYTIGGYIHLLLVVALVILLINIIQGNRSVV